MPETKPHKRHTDIADQYACDICNPPRRYAARGKPQAIPPITTAVFALELQTPGGVPIEDALSTYTVGRAGSNAAEWDHAAAWIMTSPYVHLGPATPHIGVLEYQILGGWHGRMIGGTLPDEVERWAESAAIETYVRTWLRELLAKYPGRRLVAITTRHSFTDQVENDR